MQKLMGRLNDVALMCPFLNGFKRPLLDDLCCLTAGKKCGLSPQSKKDLLVWVGLLAKENYWLPIPPEPSNPPAARKTFFSDAAGLSKDGDSEAGPGVACIGFGETGRFIFAIRHSWDSDMIRNLRDEKGVRFGDKSTTLEMLGILIPLVVIPKTLMNQHIVFGVDNMNCLFGWENKSLKGDISASIIIRAIHVISWFLGSSIHVIHIPRVSNWESDMVDRMSRLKTISREDRLLLSSFGNLSVPPVLQEWIGNPSEDWSFPLRLLSYVKCSC